MSTRQTVRWTVHRNYSRSIPRQWRDIAKVFIAMGDAHRQRILPAALEYAEQITRALQERGRINAVTRRDSQRARGLESRAA